VDVLHNLALGFSVALTPENLMYALLGCIWGTMVGMLPGIGPATGTALLIPLTFHLPPIGGIIMLAAIFYGSQYGGTISTVLLNVPGEASSVITMMDGHQMAKRGRAGVALSIAALGSFFGGTIATIGLVLFAPPLANMALKLGPPEFFSLIVMGLAVGIGLAGRSILKSLMVAVFGMLISLIGLDAVQGVPRFTFGQSELLDGIEFISLVIGLFGISELLVTLETQMRREVIDTRLKGLIPSRSDVASSVGPALRGTAIGFFLGLLPGMAVAVSSFVSYVVEKRISRHPEKFGTGTIEGIAGPETANNAHANSAMIPLFTLGIPSAPVMAVLMAAFIINGLQPGPQLFQTNPQLVWGVIASLYIGNVMLLILNLPLIAIWVQVLRIPWGILFAFILAIMVIGSYSSNNSRFDVWLMIGFGVLGYALKKLDFPLAPVLLTFILTPMMEKSLFRSLVMSQGDITILLTRPISLIFLVLALLILLSFSWRAMRPVRAAKPVD
jgi:putative tricarboxylic transport membrane protein